MLSPILPWLLIGVAALASGCSPPPAPNPEEGTRRALERQIDTQREELHQNREVLQYMEQEEAAQRRELEALDAAKTAAPARPPGLP